MAQTKVYGLTADNAVLLLEAAEQLKMDHSVVRTSSDGYFLVPDEVADKAGLGKAEETPRKRRSARRGPEKGED